MKIYKIFALILILGLAYSCEDLTELNVDEKNPETVSSVSLLSNAQKSLVDRMVSPNVNENPLRLWSQQWASTQYPQESNFDLDGRDITGSMFNELFVDVMGNLREAGKVNAGELFYTDSQRSTHNALFDVMEVYAWHVLVDLFGSVPYTGAFTDELTPVYDDGAFIYGEIATKLDNAMASIGDDCAWGAADLIYGGDTDKWKKFANSLKLRLAIRMADVNDSKASTMVAEALAAGVITDNADNFSLAYQSAPPNTNPLWEDLVQSGRTDFLAANTLVDMMNNLNDPRRAAYFDSNVDGEYIGGIAGGTNSYPAYTHVSLTLSNPTLAGTLLNAAEVHFLMADAAERGYNVTGSAAAHYEMAIRASFEEWGMSDAADDYMANADVAYDSAAGTWKQKIGMQKYLALYNRGFEAYSTYRLYDAPTLNVAEGAGVVPPSRWTFPVSEYSLNEANVSAAGDAMGGDLQSGKIFWDAN